MDWVWTGEEVSRWEEERGRQKVWQEELWLACKMKLIDKNKNKSTITG